MAKQTQHHVVFSVVYRKYTQGMVESRLWLSIPNTTQPPRVSFNRYSQGFSNRGLVPKGTWATLGSWLAVKSSSSSVSIDPTPYSQTQGLFPSPSFHLASDTTSWTSSSSQSSSSSASLFSSLSASEATASSL